MKYLNYEWTNEALLNEFKSVSGLILEHKLALENYEDFTGNRVDSFHKLEAKWREIKENLSQYTENENVAKAQEILKENQATIKAVGSEHFLFYADGSVEYKVN